MKLCPYITRFIYVASNPEPKYKRIPIETIDGEDDVLHITYSSGNYTYTEHHTECKGELCMAWEDGRCKFKR